VQVEAVHTSTTQQLRDCSIVAYLSQTLASQALEFLTNQLSNLFPVTCHLSPVICIHCHLALLILCLDYIVNLVTTMSMQLSGQLIASPIIPLFLGSCLALISHTQPVQAQINSNHILLSQQTVIETLPPPPDTSVVPYNEQPLPQLEPGQIEQYEPNPLVYPATENQYQQNPLILQPNQPNQYSQNFQRYFVYVDSDNYQTLQRVRQIEPGAYIRQYQGRSIIQSGVFNRQSNAQQRVRQLESYGIRGARVVSFSNGQEIQTFSSGSGNREYSENRNNRYYVVIPGKAQDLPVIADTIIRRSGYSSLVQERQQPFGPHVAVGPFAERGDADRWNKYVRDLGFGDARVYYNR